MDCVCVFFCLKNFRVHHYAILGHEKGVAVPVRAIIGIRGDFSSPTKTYPGFKEFTVMEA